MKPKLIIFLLAVVLFCPTVFAYSFNFSNPFPPDWNEYNVVCPVSVVPGMDIVMVPSCILFYCWPDYVDALIRIDVYKNSNFYLSSTFTDNYHRFMKNTLDTIYYSNLNLDNGSYSWRYCLTPAGTVSEYCSPYYHFIVNCVVQKPKPPIINNLKTCTAASGGSCYDALPPATFSYNVGVVYPRFNVTVSTNKADIYIFSWTSSRGAKTTTVTKSTTPNQSFIFSEIGIPVSPGDNATWFAEVDDRVNYPRTRSDTVRFSVLLSPNVPPVITLNYPGSGQSFPKGTSYVVLNATVTDVDSPQDHLKVEFKIKKPGETYFTVPCINPTVVGSTYLCPVDVLAVGRYDWKVEAIDEAQQNAQTKGSYFYIESPTSSNHLPEMDTLNPSTANVALGESITFFMNATDPDSGDKLYFDIYCNYIPNGVSENSFEDNPNASSGWVLAGVSPASQRRTCPDDTKDPKQWQTPGKYWVRACVTDGDATDGKLGFSTYTKCKDAYVNVMNTSTYVVENLDESIEWKPCLVGDGCVLNEFYYGMVGFFRGFFVYFIMLFIVLIVALTAYYIYIRVKEGFI